MTLPNLRFEPKIFSLIFSCLATQCCHCSGNTKGGSIAVPSTFCFTGVDQSVLQIKTKIVSCHTADYKPIKQEANGTVILPPLVFPPLSQHHWASLKQIKKIEHFVILTRSQMGHFRTVSYQPNHATSSLSLKELHD